jgi:hypothetical protein
MEALRASLERKPPARGKAAEAATAGRKPAKRAEAVEPAAEPAAVPAARKRAKKA